MSRATPKRCNRRQAEANSQSFRREDAAIPTRRRCDTGASSLWYRCVVAVKSQPNPEVNSQQLVSITRRIRGDIRLSFVAQSKRNFVMGSILSDLHSTQSTITKRGSISPQLEKFQSVPYILSTQTFMTSRRLYGRNRDIVGQYRSCSHSHLIDIWGTVQW